jgi:hypothetical protein
MAATRAKISSAGIEANGLSLSAATIASKKLRGSGDAEKPGFACLRLIGPTVLDDLANGSLDLMLAGGEVEAVLAPNRDLMRSRIIAEPLLCDGPTTRLPTRILSTSAPISTHRTCLSAHRQANAVMQMMSWCWHCADEIDRSRSRTAGHIIRADGKDMWMTRRMILKL